MRRLNHSPNARRHLLWLRIAVFALLLAVIVLATSGCFLFPNVRPVARIEVNRTGGVAPLTV
ncbi:hypothetical protein ACFLTM_04540, partial [Candidatus Bipolaricaulota bacterium]